METHDIGWGRITSLMVQGWQPLKYGFDRYPQPASTELSEPRPDTRHLALLCDFTTAQPCIK